MLESIMGKSFNPEKEIPSLKGKVIIVTGGNTGLGKETVLQLAKHSPQEIFLAARTASKAEAAIAEITQAVPNSKVSFLHLDLTSFASIKQAADDFTARSARLDILINNAGIMAVPFSLTKENYEIQFGTNHLGHALFTKLLLPTLLRTAADSADVRVINVSSEGHRLAPTQGIIYDQPLLESQGTWARYGQSKLANILHARALQSHHPALTATAVHPGVIMTDLYASSAASNPGVKVFGYLAKGATGLGLLYDVPKGTKNQLWAATTATREEVRSSWYWKPVAIKSAGSGYAQDAKLAEQLWEWTEKEFEKQGY